MERIPVEAWKIRGCMSHVVMVHKSWENHKSKTSNIASSLSLPAEPHLSTQGCGNMVKAKEIGSFSPWNRGISSNSSQAQICSVHRRGHSWGEETGMNCSSGCQTKFTIPTAWAPAPSLPHGVAAPAPHTVPSLLERAQRGSGRGLGLSLWCCVRAQNGLTLPKSWRRRDHVALQSHQGWNRAVGLELLTSAILLFYSSVQAVANGASALLGGVGWRLRISGKTQLCVGMRGCSSLLSAQAHRARADNSPHISPSPAGRLSLPCLSAEAAHLHQARTSALICVRHSTGRCFLQMAFV